MAAEVCSSFKWGEFNPLRCARSLGHEGAHAYVVVKEQDEDLMRLQQLRAKHLPAQMNYFSKVDLK